MIQVVAVVGPTGSGKTEVAIEVADALGTDIVSADSMQFYRGMVIGTGQPTAEQQARVRHHFVGHLAPDERMSAGEFARAAGQVVEGLNAGGRPAILVGGSGLYVRALIDGLFEGPGRDSDIRERLQAEAEESGPEPLYARLREVDEEYAARIQPTDLRRIVRALEVYEISGSPLSALHAQQQESPPKLNAVQFALDWPRDALYDRINRRVDAMLESGFLDEVRGLIDAGYGEELERLKAIGYRELAVYLRGGCSLDEAVALTKMYSRRYAKRQLTWFRGDTRIRWLPADETKTATFHAEQILEQVSVGLSSAE